MHSKSTHGNVEIAVVLAALAVGCTSANDSDSTGSEYPPERDLVGRDAADGFEEMPSADPEGGLTVPHIYTQLYPEGSRSRQRGAIEVCFDGVSCCSGSILNSNMIMTAAHCLPTPNQSGFQSVTIRYDIPIDPSRPFCPSCVDTLTWRFRANTGGFCPECREERMFFYPHPSQTRANPRDVSADWDVALGVVCSAGSACDDGFTATQSLVGINEWDFVTILTRNLADNMGLRLFGYGVPETGRQHTMQTSVEDDYSRSIWWHASVLFEVACQGDSGGPGTRSSGYSDRLGSYWLTQGTVLSTSTTEASFTYPNGSKSYCGAEGRATKLRDKTSWIKTIVEYWTPKTCNSWTNPAGEAFQWCWQNR